MSSNRRDFLKTALGTSAVISLEATTPGFLLNAAAAQERSNEETVLVVVQLSGGNDGLNTVVPYTNSRYYNQRPKLAIPKDDVLTIDDSLGFHPEMRGFADLLESNKLSVVQGVGYPNPNRSHFESMDIWHTCRRKGNARTTGWLGRFLDATRDTAGRDAAAVHLGEEKTPLALAASNVRTPSIRSLERFRLNDAGNEELRALIAGLSAAERKASNDLLGFIQTSTTSAIQASERVEEAAKQYKPSVEYPETALAQKMKSVAQLIDAGLSTRVYYVSIDGFDTHAQQPDAHAGLVGQVSSSIASFVNDVAQHGHGKRVLVMAFSEFGRRVKENASDGTDHGAAAPMFLAGQRVEAGVIGKHPSLSDLEDGDLKHHTDFRQVYAAVLDNWLGWSSKDVLGDEYQPVDVIS